ncbi:Ig-like domain-containing protein [Vibrio salinus]|uniref:Ig-like domain-containing protein n=1 Tax=Vibrio salinus TaxID=2899784 RepID=UPI001E5F1F89|nr:Ig-like domain-containing protein [Vibrio salinus]MCE0492398.1 Ig-like domain-containing protein [Vibrio salinus]
MDQKTIISPADIGIDQSIVIDKDGNVTVIPNNESVPSGSILVKNGQFFNVENDGQSPQFSAELITPDNQSIAITNEIDQIITALEQGVDPTQLADEFAAAAGGVTGSSLAGSATITSNNTELLASTFFDTSATAGTGITQAQSLALVQTLVPTIATTTDVLDTDLSSDSSPLADISSAIPSSSDITRSVPTISFDNVVRSASISLEDADVNNDGVYNSAELGGDGTVEATVTLPGDFNSATDSLYINDSEYTLSADEISSGSVTVDIDPQEEIRAYIIDGAANTSTEASATALSADTEVQPPVIVLEDADTNDDGVYNSNELGADGTVEATITLPGDFNSATDTLYINDSEYTLSADEISSGSVTVNIDPTEEIRAYIVDGAGNTSTEASATALGADTEVQPPVIALEDADANDDGVYNSAELGADGTVEATITLPDDFNSATDTLYINDSDYTLSADEISSGSVTVNIDPTEEIRAYIVDGAGNTSTEASATALSADTEVQPPVIALEDADSNDDGVYNADELGADGTVEATITLPDDFNSATDTLYINDSEYTLSAGEISNGSVMVDIDPQEEIRAYIVDGAGNTSTEASATALSADTEVQPPVIALEDADSNDDGVYNSAELGADGTVEATITLPDDFNSATDTLYINDSDYTLSADEISSGSVTVDIDPQEEIRAYIVDGAGNTSTEASATALGADTEVQPPVIALEDADSNDDGVYNADELGGDGTVEATITLPGDFNSATDTLYINDSEYTLSAGEISNGSVMVDIDPQEEIRAYIVDGAGNTSTEASATALSADTEVQPPVIALEDADSNDDGVYNSAELGADGTVEATITLPNDFNSATDTLYINDSDYTLSADEISSGSVTVDIDPQEEIRAYIVDGAGNTSTEASATALGADTEVQPPVIALEDADSNDDGVYNADELGGDGTVEATITLPGDFNSATDSLYINDSDYTLSADEISSGSVMVDIDPQEEIRAYIVDGAGNTSDEVSATALSADTEVQPPVIALEDADSNDDGVYNSAELGADGTVEATITLPGDFNSATDTLYINDSDYTLSADEISSGSVTVDIDPQEEIRAYIVDGAGNTSTEASATALGADLIAPTVTITALDTNLSIGESTTVTFQFSEMVQDFTAVDVSVTGGSLSNFQQVDDDTWTATYTHTVDSEPTISVPDDSYVDIAGNSGSGYMLAMTTMTYGDILVGEFDDDGMPSSIIDFKGNEDDLDINDFWIVSDNGEKVLSAGGGNSDANKNDDIGVRDNDGGDGEAATLTSIPLTFDGSAQSISFDIKYDKDKSAGNADVHVNVYQQLTDESWVLVDSVEISTQTSGKKTYETGSLPDGVYKLELSISGDGIASIDNIGVQQLSSANDNLVGGDDNDIIFGDSVDTSNLPWEDDNHADLVGVDAIKSFLESTGDSDVTDEEVFNYISENPDMFASDTNEGGDDDIDGGAGNDILYGYGGEDEIHGGSGDDIIYGGAGVDHLHGDAGEDIFVLDHDSVDTIEDFNSNEDIIDISDLIDVSDI